MKLLKTNAWAVGILAGAAFIATQSAQAQTLFAGDPDLPNGNLGSVAITPPSTIALSTAQGITYSPSGSIAVSYFSGPINIYSSSGQYQSTFANLGSGNAGLAYDSAGDLFVSHVNSVIKYSPTGTSLGTFATVSGVTGLAFDTAGNLYAAGGSAVFEYDTTGTLLHTFTASDLTSAFGLAFTPSGNLLAANFGGTTIDEFSPSGTFLGDFASGLNGPAGIAADGLGDIYEVDRNTRTINELNSSGTIINSFSTPSILPTYDAVQPTPEPTALVLGGIGAIALLGLRRRK